MSDDDLMDHTCPRDEHDVGGNRCANHDKDLIVEWIERHVYPRQRILPWSRRRNIDAGYNRLKYPVQAAEAFRYTRYLRFTGFARCVETGIQYCTCPDPTHFPNLHTLRIEGATRITHSSSCRFGDIRPARLVLSSAGSFGSRGVGPESHHNGLKSIIEATADCSIIFRSDNWTQSLLWSEADLAKITEPPVAERLRAPYRMLRSMSECRYIRLIFPGTRYNAPKAKANPFALTEKAVDDSAKSLAKLIKLIPKRSSDQHIVIYTLAASDLHETDHRLPYIAVYEAKFWAALDETYREFIVMKGLKEFWEEGLGDEADQVTLGYEACRTD